MRLRPFYLDDVGWASPLAERVLTHLDTGYGAAIARWAAAPSVDGYAIDDIHGPLGFILVSTLGLMGAGQTRILEVLALVVHPAHRRRGVGRSLLARAVQDAKRDAGVREIRLEVAADNVVARHLFAQAGFTVDRENDGNFAGGQRVMRLGWRPARPAPSSWNL